MLTIDWVGPASSSNFEPGRRGRAVVGIVDHWIGVGTAAGAASYFRSYRPDRPSSAHYIVASDGRILQVVAEDDTAYHAGDFDVNLRTVGIEHEATPDLAPSDALYRASSELHRAIASRHGFELVRGVTVFRHNEIVTTACPGTLDVDRIVREGNGMADEDAKRAREILEAREALVWIARLQRGLDVETGKPFDASVPPRDPRIAQ